MKSKENKLSRRKAIGYVGIGALAMHFSSASFARKEYRPFFKEPLHYLTISEIGELIKSKKISSLELTQTMLARIRVVDNTLKSYTTIMSEQALSKAKDLDNELAKGKHRGPLHGIPIGIKDLLYTRGVRTMAGTMALADFIPEFNATVVTRLEEAGAVVLGKLALCEGAFSPYHPKFQVPVNPWDATRWSGVSSSGSGVATAAGLCFGSIGTDTGGSIRYPSAVNGCVGLKPTYGRVSRFGVFGLAESMDHVGPMTRTVEDAAIMFEAMAGKDSNDPTSLATPVQKIRDGLSLGVSGLRIGFDRHYATNNVDTEVAEAIVSVLKELTRQGAKVVDVKMPDITEIAGAWYNICIVEAVLANANTYPSKAADYGPGFRAELENGLKVSGIEFAKACKVRAVFTTQIKQLLETVDCFVCPAMSNTAYKKIADPYARETDDTWATVEPNDIYTKPFNFSGSPTLSVPCGFSSEGLPIGVQFVGSDLNEAMICRIGYAYETHTEWHKRHPNI
jgi:amidase